MQEQELSSITGIAPELHVGSLNINSCPNIAESSRCVPLNLKNCANIFVILDVGTFHVFRLIVLLLNISSVHSPGGNTF